MTAWADLVPSWVFVIAAIFVVVMFYLWRRDRDKLAAAMAAVRVAVPTSLDVQKAETAVASAARGAAQTVAQDVAIGAAKLAAALEPAAPPPPAIAIHGSGPLRVERDDGGTIHVTTN